MPSHEAPAKLIRAIPIKTVVSDPEWQKIRQSLVGKWVHQHTQNVATLRSYLALHHWSPLATRQVLNVLTGTVHRVGHTAGQAETDALRAEVRRQWKRLLGETFDPKDPRYTLGVIGAGPNDAFPE